METFHKENSILAFNIISSIVFVIHNKTPAAELKPLCSSEKQKRTFFDPDANYGQVSIESFIIETKFKF